MRIARVDAFPIAIGGVGAPTLRVSDDHRVSVYADRHQTLVARVETDDGVVGYGEGQAPIVPQAVGVIVETALTPMLLGRNPLDTTALWQRMYGAMRERGHQTGFYPDALAAIDLALWDIKGKALGQPVHRLLGGAFRQRVGVYANVSSTIPSEAAEEARACVDAGFRAVKLHTWASADQTAALAHAVRERVGPDVKIMVDVHTSHTVSSAIALGRKLEAIDAAWLESPLPPEDIGGIAEVSRALAIPIASAEWTRTRWDVREAFERRAFDIVMPDVARTGLTEGMALAALADAYNIPVAPHVGGGGVLSTAATIHYSAALPNFFVMEFNPAHYPDRARIASSKPDIVDGAFPLPTAPGLGVEISDDALKAHVLRAD